MPDTPKINVFTLHVNFKHKYIDKRDRDISLFIFEILKILINSLFPA